MQIVLLFFIFIPTDAWQLRLLSRTNRAAPQCVQADLLNRWIYLSAALPWLCLRTKAIGSALQRDEFIQHSSIKQSHQDKESMLSGAGFPIDRRHWPAVNTAALLLKGSRFMIQAAHFLAFIFTVWELCKALEQLQGHSKVCSRAVNYCSLIRCYILQREGPKIEEAASGSRRSSNLSCLRA